MSATWAPALAPLGVCAYIAGFVWPLPWNAPLIVLTLLGGLALLLDRHDLPNPNAPLFALVCAFLISRLTSTAVSDNLGRSARLGAAVAFGVLLFVLIASHFRSPMAIWRLYATFAIIGLSLSSAVIWAAWRSGRGSPLSWVTDVGSPIIVVPNDLAFLSVIAPLSLSLACQAPRPVTRAVAAASLVSSMVATALARSRVATLTMVLSVSLAAAAIRLRLGIVCGLSLVGGALLSEILLGFPLAAKFSSGKEFRIGLWAAAWTKFLEAPWLGHGPYTFVYTSADRVTTTWTHNLYLELLVEQGLVGLLAFAVLLGSALWAAWNTRVPTLSEARYLASAAFAGLIAFGFAGLFESSFVRQWVVITFFALLGVTAQLASARPD